MKRQIFSGLIIAGVLSLAGCGSEPESSEPQLRPVRTVTIGDAVGLRTRTLSGISKPALESRLSFKVTGTIIELPAQVGYPLSAGDLVARLDPSPFELQAQQAQATTGQARANERNALANYERIKGLYENSNASRNDLDAARAAAESARAQVGAAQKALELARLNVEYTRLTAADDCTVASVNADLNENIASGSPVAVVNCGAGLEVEVLVPEGLIAAISQDMPAEVRFSATGERIFAARVSEVGVSSSADAATFPVTLSLLEPDENLRSGLAAEVIFSFASAESTFLIPLSAAIRNSDGNFVYLAIPKEQGRAVIQVRPVTIGNLTDRGLEVTDGLQTGDLVITAGVSFVRPGQQVLYRSSD